MEFFDQNDIKILDWPSQSPDLNPIENIWSWIKRKLRKMNIQSLDKLKVAITEIWLSIPLELLKKLSASMKKRFMDILKLKGSSFNF